MLVLNNKGQIFENGQQTEKTIVTIGEYITFHRSVSPREFEKIVSLIKYYDEWDGCTVANSGGVVAAC